MIFMASAVVLANRIVLSTVLVVAAAFGALGNRPISAGVEASNNLSLTKRLMQTRKTKGTTP